VSEEKVGALNEVCVNRRDYRNDDNCMPSGYNGARGDIVKKAGGRGCKQDER
jgi:hypothetical protein